jgi:RNA polymerase sigma factor (sigma-70 family)
VEPWRAKLDAGDAEAAWSLFDERYRRLILATIRRLIAEPDELMDVFSTVCQALSADGCSRLKRYTPRADATAGAATWVVAVVRNLAIDWLRQRDGRRRLSVPAALSPLQQQIYSAICIDGHSHTEAFEVIRSQSGSTMAFHEFLREVRATHLVAPCPQSAPLRRQVRESSPLDVALPPADPVESAEAAGRLSLVLASQPADVRLAVELFVVERMAAADVARVVGWPNAKAVYNRIYRVLAALRAELGREGIGPGDL